MHDLADNFDWRRAIRDLHEWATNRMTDDDRQRVGLDQADMLYKTVIAIQNAVRERNDRG
jgi:hypothetical protein